MATIPITSHPASFSASTHSREDPPVEIKSSTTITFIPGLTKPSIRLFLPWDLAPPRTYPIGKPKIFATNAAWAIPAVAVPIKHSHSG